VAAKPGVDPGQLLSGLEKFDDSGKLGDFLEVLFEPVRIAFE
jgi:hypothetical protein